MAAIGADDVLAALPGGVGNVNAKLRLMTQQNDTLLTTLAATGNLFTMHTSGIAAVSGTAVFLTGIEKFMLHVTGTGSGTVTFQGSIDGSNWFNVAMRDTTTTAAATLVTTVVGTATPALGAFVLPTEYALTWIRANITTYTGGAFIIKGKVNIGI